MTAMHQWSGREASALRAARRMTIRGFAEYLGISPRTVANWQAKGDAICPVPELQEALDTALAKSTPDARARFAALLQRKEVPLESGRAAGSRHVPSSPDIADPGAIPPRDWAEPYPPSAHGGHEAPGHAQLGQLTTAGQVDDILQQLQDRWHHLVKTDNLLGPRYALPGVLDQLRIIDGLLECVHKTARVAVLKVGAQYAESAAWLHEDGGDLATARYWNRRAMEWALEADDRPMLAWTLFRSSQHAAIGRNGGLVIDLARAARREAEILAAPARAAIALQEGQGHALEGEEAEAQHLFDEAHRWAATDVEGDARDGHGSFCTESYIEMQRAGGWLTLQRPHRAIELYERVLPNMPAVYRRDRGMGLGRLASAHVAANQPEQAASVAREALAIAQSSGSTRTLSEVTSVGQSLRMHRQLPSVAQLLVELTQSRA